MDPKTLIEEIGKARKSRQKEYEIAMRGRVDENGKETGEGGYLAEAYKLESGHPEILDQNLHWTVRSSIAMQVAQKVLQERQGGSRVTKTAPEITKLETTKNLTELLKDPAKYGLEKKDVEGLLDAAWFINEGDDKLDPDEIASGIKSQKLADRIKKDANLPVDTRSANYTRYKNKIEKEGVGDDELFEERRTRTLSYLEQLALEQRQSKDKSNTATQLRALEMDIAFLKSNGAKLSPELRSKAIESIGSNTAAVKSAFRSEAALEFFKSPTNFLASKAGNAAAKAVSAKVTGAVIAAGLTTVAPVVGTAVGFVAGQYINKAVVYGIDKAKKGAKLAVAASAGFILFIASTLTVAASSVVGAVATLIILIPFLIALIVFIINTGGYIVPPSDSGIADSGSGFIDVPEGPGECPEGPAGWPVDVSRGQVYLVSQGPFSNSSHYGLEAIDVLHPSNSYNNNNTVIATHPGTVRSAGTDSYGGKYVDIEGSCNGVQFRSRHVHFFIISPGIVAGATVARGRVLGVMGNTGYSDKGSKHDHYEFRALEAFGGNPFANSPIPMSPPYLPKAVARGCGDGVGPNCGVSVP